LGSISSWFNNIYGTAIHAQYADLAERFHADEEYPAGTVVEMGGVNEITKVVEELSERVFGVISTNAAYLMNSRAGTDATHPPIAMSGRVPVRVTGIISKGDRLVSAGNGLARTGLRSELTPFNVIGRALENKTTDSEGVIEAIVKLNS
jgi:enamine deaminase RidA (YjgF/YER057c/UK114 family)